MRIDAGAAWPSLVTARRLHALGAAGSAAIGLLVLVGGWLLDIDEMKSWLPGLATMKPNSAIGFLLCGTSLWCLRSDAPARRRVARGAAAAVMLLAGVTLAQDFGDWNFGIDELLFDDPDSAYTLSPGRMSMATSMAFLLMGAALLHLDHRRAEALVLLGLVPPMVSFVGLAYGSDPIMAPFNTNTIGLPNLCAFGLLGLGILSARPRRGIMRYFASQGPEGMLTRRTLLGALVIIPAVGMVAQLGQNAGLYGHNSREAFEFIGTLLGMVVLLLRGAGKLARIDAARQRGIDALQLGEQRLRETNAELARTLESARLSEERARQAVAVARIGLFELDHRTHDLHWSGRLREIIGWDADAPAARRAYRDLIPAEQREAFVAAVLAAENPSGDGLYEVEHPLRRPDGQLRWLYVRGQTLFEGEGAQRRPTRTIGATLDITERKAAERQLVESEQRMRLAAEAANFGMYDRDMQGAWFHVSPELKQLLGYAPDTPLDHAQVMSHMHPDERERGLAAFERACDPAGDGRIRIEQRIVRRDGEVRWISTVGRVFFKDGVPQRSLGFWVDISEQKRAEERFRQVVEGAPNAMVMVDFDGRIVLVNAEAERLFGYRRDELLGREIEVLVPDSVRAGHPTLRAGYLKGPTRRAMGVGRELHGRRKDGQQVSVEIGLNPIETPEGRFLLAAIVDITERERLQRELLQANADLERRVDQRTRELAEKAEQLERASRVKSEFLANMSHELRTPLNSLLILSQLLAENSGGNLTERQTTYARTIHGAGRDLLQLIDDILDLAKVEAGKVELQPEPVVLAEIAEELDRIFRPLAEQKRLAFDIRIDPAAPPRIRTDPRRLRQILKNLLSNAIKFTERGGVWLHIDPVDGAWPDGPAGPDRADCRVAMSVHDTGIGIAPDKQSLIFDAFRQADGSTSRRFGGTGLGLTISRDLTELLAGALTVRSAPDEGSCFTLWLPADCGVVAATLGPVGAPPPALPAPSPASSLAPDLVAQAPSAPRPDGSAPPPAADAGEPDGPGPAPMDRTLLLVDDDVRNLFALTGLLEQHGIEVVVAESGGEALAQLAAHPEIDLVLMDIMMPGMDGFDAIRAIRADVRHAGLPVIALTAKAMTGDREKCLEAGASDYLSKPVEPDRLVRLLRLWLCR